MNRYASRIALPALALAVALAWAAPARAQLGLGGGVNFNSMDDVTTGGADLTFENSTGWHLGAFVDVSPAGPVGFRPGVFYHRVGTYTVAGESFDMSSVDLSLDLNYRVMPLAPVSPYLLAGPVVTFPRAEDAFDDDVEDLALTADIGVGIEFSLTGTGMAVMPELRYSIGATDFLSDDIQVGDTTLQPSSDERRLSKVVLRLNVLF